MGHGYPLSAAMLTGVALRVWPKHTYPTVHVLHVVPSVPAAKVPAGHAVHASSKLVRLMLDESPLPELQPCGHTSGLTVRGGQ